MQDKKIEQSKSPQKQCYEIRLQAMAPIECLYRVYAESEEDALKKITKTTVPNNIKPFHLFKHWIEASVCRAGSSLVKLKKKYK